MKIKSIKRNYCKHIVKTKQSYNYNKINMQLSLSYFFKKSLKEETKLSQLTNVTYIAYSFSEYLTWIKIFRHLFQINLICL